MGVKSGIWKPDVSDNRSSPEDLVDGISYDGQSTSLLDFQSPQAQTSRCSTACCCTVYREASPVKGQIDGIGHKLPHDGCLRAGRRKGLGLNNLSPVGKRHPHLSMLFASILQKAKSSRFTTRRPRCIMHVHVIGCSRQEGSPLVSCQVSGPGYSCNPTVIHNPTAIPTVISPPISTIIPLIGPIIQRT